MVAISLSEDFKAFLKQINFDGNPRTLYEFNEDLKRIHGYGFDLKQTTKGYLLKFYGLNYLEFYPKLNYDKLSDAVNSIEHFFKLVLK